MSCPLRSSQCLPPPLPPLPNADLLPKNAHFLAPVEHAFVSMKNFFFKGKIRKSVGFELDQNTFVIFVFAKQGRVKQLK